MIVIGVKRSEERKFCTVAIITLMLDLYYQHTTINNNSVITITNVSFLTLHITGSYSQIFKNVIIHILPTLMH